MEELNRLSSIRDEAEKELLRCLREDARIADNMRDLWMNRADGADCEGG